jgi:hypothetical protein
VEGRLGEAGEEKKSEGGGVKEKGGTMVEEGEGEGESRERKREEEGGGREKENLRRALG